MWDIDLKYLQKDEVIEYTDRPSMLSCILSYIWVGFMALSAIMMFIFSISESNAAEIRPLIWVYVLFASPGIYVILKRLSTRYAISIRGLLLRTGIITNNIKTVPFKHITSIEVKETIIGKICKYPHLLIETSGSGQAIEFEWKFVGTAHKVKKLIETHVGGEN